MTDDEKSKYYKIIHTAAVSSAMSVITEESLGQSEIPLLVISIKMVIRLGKVFEMDITRNVAGAIVSKFISAEVGKLTPFTKIYTDIQKSVWCSDNL